MRRPSIQHAQVEPRIPESSIARGLPEAAAAATGILVGAAIVATRFVIAQTGPASLALWRYLIGFCCLLPPVLMAPRIRFARGDLLPIGLLGIAQFGISIALLNYALQFIHSARAALIFATFPLLTLILATVFGRETLTLAKTLGVGMTIVGVGLALGEKTVQSGGAPNGWVGELAVFASALTGAICTVLYRPYLQKYTTLSVSAAAMLAAIGFLAVLASREELFRALPHFTPAGWLAVVFIGICSGVGYYLWLWALNHTTPTQVTVFLALSPITAAVLGVLFLHEETSSMFILGLACVVFGVWIAPR